MKKVTIALDKERELKYNINAMVDLEERFKVPVTKLFVPEMIGFGFIRAVMMIGLKHGGMKISGNDLKAQEENVGVLLHEHWFVKGKTLDDAMGFVMEAFKEAGLMPRDENEVVAAEAEANPSEGTDV